MSIEIRAAQAADAQGIWKLIHELAVYERSGSEMVLTPVQIRRDIEKNLFHAFVAIHGEEIIGMALFYPIYSTWKGLSYYLEDLIVSEPYRRQGVGKKLFDKVMEYAKAKNAGRLGWQVLEWNEPAIAFYKKYDAEFDEEWITCRIRKEKLQAFNTH